MNYIYLADTRSLHSLKRTEKSCYLTYLLGGIENKQDNLD